MTEARQMTFGADSRSALRRSFLALLSPASTLSERVCNAVGFSFMALKTQAQCCSRTRLHSPLCLWWPDAIRCAARESPMPLVSSHKKAALRSRRSSRSVSQWEACCCLAGALPRRAGQPATQEPRYTVFLSHAIPFTHRAIVVQTIAATLFPSYS